jgi:hypothetical protein
MLGWIATRNIFGLGARYSTRPPGLLCSSMRVFNRKAPAVTTEAAISSAGILPLLNTAPPFGRGARYASAACPGSPSAVYACH